MHVGKIEGFFCVNKIEGTPIKNYMSKKGLGTTLPPPWIFRRGDIIETKSSIQEKSLAKNNDILIKVTIF